MTDPRLFSPAAERNRGPILDVLRPLLPGRHDVLEIASGTGEHVVHFAASLQESLFQPSDPDEDARRSIDAWAAEWGLPNIRAAIALDAASRTWPALVADMVLCINMIHIAPWAATLGLMRGAASLLAPGGYLFLYGPFRREGGHTAPSNAMFDEALRARNPEWGVRDLERVAAEAAERGFASPEIHALPANNLAVVFRRG